MTATENSATDEPMSRADFPIYGGSHAHGAWCEGCHMYAEQRNAEATAKRIAAALDNLDEVFGMYGHTPEDHVPLPLVVRHFVRDVRRALAGDADGE
jgi:hypothetical protein